MRSALAVPLLLSVPFALSNTTGTAAPREQVIRSQVRVVAVYVRVFDLDDRFVGDLTADDFELYEDDVRSREVAFTVLDAVPPRPARSCRAMGSEPDCELDGLPDRGNRGDRVADDPLEGSTSGPPNGECASSFVAGCATPTADPNYEQCLSRRPGPGAAEGSTHRLAWDHDLRRRVTTVFLSAVFRLLREHARAVGLEQPRGGAVAIIPALRRALNLNVHIHALVLDGAVARDAAGWSGFIRRGV